MALKGKNTEEKIYNYFKEKGINDYGICGLMGNLYAESGLIPDRVEILCLKRLKENGKSYTDKTYTQAVDSGKITRAGFLNPLPNKQYGYGLAQWTSPVRKAKLYDMAKKTGVSIGDLKNSLDFLWSELTTNYTSVLSVLKTAASVKQASDIVLKKFECPADTGSAVQNTRASYGTKYYNQLVKKAASDSNTSSKPAAQTDTVSQVISTAKNEVGYLEKASNVNLDSKTANAGYNNYTKYWRDIAAWGLGNYQAQYWCAAFVYWCFVKTFGLDATKKLLYHAPYIYCPTAGNLFKQHGRLYSDPKQGDIVVFMGSGGVYGHTGIVYKVDTSCFYTIEGNTSSASGVVANGGCVAYKQYSIANAKNAGHRFCRPNYSIVGGSSGTDSGNGSGSSAPSSPVVSTKLNESVKWTGIVTADELNVRTWAGSENKTCSFSPLKKNTTVSVCDSVKDKSGAVWYYIKYNGKYGFVHGDYIKKKSGASSAGTGTKKQTASDAAKSFSKTLAGTYKTTADLNIRHGAGTDKKLMVTIPKGTKIQNYGYYTAVSGTKWLYVQFTHKNTAYTGFASGSYLKKQ